MFSEAKERTIADRRDKMEIPTKVLMHFPIMSRSEWLIICTVFVVYLILAVELARVRPPHADEGSFGNAAAIFQSKHYLAMPMRNEAWLPGLDKHMYVTPPLYFMGLGAWFRVFGIDLITMRYFSIFWGVVLLASWYVIVRTLSGDRLISLLALILIGVNYDYANLTSGRYDAMSAALSAAGLATYLSLRGRNLSMALLLGNFLVAGAFMTHPYGLFGFVGLVLLVIGLDRDRIHLKQLVLSAGPYIVALIGWGIYIAQDPAMFRLQFTGNASGRLSYLSRPLQGLYAEIRHRYIMLLAGWRPDVPVYMKFKILIIFFILFSIIGCFFIREIRQNRHYKLLLALVVLWFVMLTYLDATKTYIYLVHIWPLYFALVAIFLGMLMKRGAALKYLAVTCVVMLVLFSIISVAYRARLNSYQEAYVPAVQFLEQHVDDNALVIAPGEFGFTLGFDQHVLDDVSLGYKTGKRPKYIVVDKQWETFIEREKQASPTVGKYIDNLLSTQYRLVFTSKSGYDFYRIYSRIS